MAKRCYYDIVGAEKSASVAELKVAYRRKVKELHPDQNRDNPDAETLFKEVNEAYDILKDPEKKAAYDRFGHAAFEGGTGASAGQGGGGNPFGGGGFSDIFEDLFGGFAGGGQRGGGQRATRGQDLRYNLNVTLEEAFAGKQTDITVPGSVSCEACSGTGAEGGAEPENCPTCAGMGKVRAQQGFFTVERTCPSCHGRGQIIKNPCGSCAGAGRVQKDRTLRIDVPAGVETGTRIRHTGAGEAGTRGGPAGDLYIFIEVEEHSIFERDGANLFCSIPISMTTAALGGELEAPTIDGGRTKVKVPSGVQSGKQLRLRGKGMPALRGSGVGDLYIELGVETPTNLTSRQKELLREFEAESKDNNPASHDFFSRVKSFWEGMTG
ncbi:MAG: molecular chaperone DnaJ [Rhodobacteraceae bacterium]|nr:molecular chaperone DnaJ [Paracoccaceae bacterium]